MFERSRFSSGQQTLMYVRNSSLSGCIEVNFSLFGVLNRLLGEQEMQYDSVNKKKTENRSPSLYHDLRKRVRHPQQLVFILIVTGLVLVV